MNIPSPMEDTDFPVFKAGPPLPLRTKGKPQVKTKMTPLKPSTSSSSAVISSSKSSVNVNQAESKVKQYIERVKAKDELGRKKRLKAEQMLSLEDLYQVDLNEPNSKLEEISPKPNEKELEEIQDKLRETMRIVKEKDELINKLRESCHDLRIKCADAENRVDELRFSYGRSSLTLANEQPQSHSQPIASSSFHNPRKSASIDGLFPQNSVKEDRECSKVKTAEISVPVTVEKQDAHTQVDSPNLQLLPGNESQQTGEWREEDDILQETCSNWMEKVQNWKTDSNFNLSQDSGGDRDSGFRSSAEIDNESSTLNRRQQQQQSQSNSQRLISPRLPNDPISITNSTTRTSEKSLKVPNSTSTSMRCKSCKCKKEEEVAPLTIPIAVPGPSSSMNPPGPQQDRHFWPSSSLSQSQSQFHLNRFQNQTESIKSKSLFYELAEAERNKCAHFHEGYRYNRNRLSSTKSLDVLYFPENNIRTKEELRSLIDSSFDPPEFILKSHLNSQHRSIQKKVKMLDPLLDDATQIALRVKQKSERLAKMLHDARVFD